MTDTAAGGFIDLLEWSETDGTFQIAKYNNATTPISVTSGETTASINAGRASTLPGGEVLFPRGIFFGDHRFSTRHMTNATAAPSSGAHGRGDLVWNRSAAAGGVLGWVCVASGRLAIATSTSRPNVDLLMDTCFGSGAGTIFDVIASGSDVRRKKPAPDLYLRAIDCLGIEAERCIAIEDSRLGVCSAKAAGLRVVATPSRYTEQDDFSEADLRIPSLEQIDMAMLGAIGGQPAFPGQDWQPAESIADQQVY